MSKTVDFKEFRASKNGEITPKALIEHLLQAIESGEIKNVAYVAQNNDDSLDFGCNNMPQTQIIGLFECGKQMVIEDMHEY